MITIEAFHIHFLPRSFRVIPLQVRPGAKALEDGCSWFVLAAARLTQSKHWKKRLKKNKKQRIYEQYSWLDKRF